MDTLCQDLNDKAADSFYANSQQAYQTPGVTMRRWTRCVRQRRWMTPVPNFKSQLWVLAGAADGRLNPMPDRLLDWVQMKSGCAY